MAERQAKKTECIKLAMAKEQNGERERERERDRERERADRSLQ